MDDRTDRFAGRFDAVQLAAGIAPLTSSIGLLPTATVTHTEPFHVSTAIATLDYVSEGRAGWQVKVSDTAAQAGNFGRRPAAEFTPGDPQRQAALASDLLAEASDAVEVVRALWDSWEDGAVIRDVDTGRYLDRSRLHHINFHGSRFAVRGPSIIPRPPQGQPVVAVLAHGVADYRFAAQAADIVYVTPQDTNDARAVVTRVRAAQEQVGRPGPPLKIFADLLVLLGESWPAAADRRARWDELAGEPLTSDAEIFVGSPAVLAERLARWRAVGLDGFRLRPGSAADDPVAVTRGLVPELRNRGLLPRVHEGATRATLRERLGLGRPANRYAA